MNPSNITTDHDDYRPHTTTDPRSHDPGIPGAGRRRTPNPAAEAIYPRDTNSPVHAPESETQPLTTQIATITTRHGGRIPVGLSPRVHNSGDRRWREWRVYVPQDNPHEIPAKLQDALNNADGIADATVQTTETGETKEKRLRYELGRVQHDDDDAPIDDDDAIEAVATVARLTAFDIDRGLEQHVIDDIGEAYRDAFKHGIEAVKERDAYDGEYYDCAVHAGDAWNMVQVDVEVLEIPDDPMLG